MLMYREVISHDKWHSKKILLIRPAANEKKVASTQKNSSTMMQSIWKRTFYKHLIIRRGTLKGSLDVYKFDYVINLG
jgi:hypothetical protein